jgi:hypothetical protein
MWRYLMIVLGSAALGSLGGTVGFVLIMGGTGSPDPVGFVSGFTLFTMIFTTPGSIMLIGLRDILAERGLGRLQRDALVALFGALSGALILGLISPHNGGLGAFYGLSTAVALMVVQRLVEALGRARA